MLHAIAAMSENRVIAHHGKIPWRLPEDFRWFKHKTMGGILIMGRKTCESLPGPLPGRKNCVLSRQHQVREGFSFYSNADNLLTELGFESVAWVIGGGEIYAQLLPRCTFLYLTRVKREVEGDVFFPPFEDSFTLDQVIHENADFRVESWRNSSKLTDPAQPEAWPY